MVTKLVAAVALGIGSVATIATAAAFFGGIWWGLDLLANYRWQTMWAALFASVLYALSGRGLFTAVFIVAAVINLWLILPAWVGSHPAASGEDTIEVTHADLSGMLDDVEASIAWLVHGDPDLLLIAGAPADAIDAILVADGSSTLLNRGSTSSGVAVFARGDWTITTAFDAGGEPVYRITVPSGAGVIDVVTAWGPMATSGSTSDALDNRFTTITETVASSVNPVAVIGNLGATKWSTVSRSLLGATGLRDATEGFGYLSTWPTSDLPIIGRWVGIPIDVAYVGPELAPIEVIVGPDIGTDHLPLTIEISPVAVDES